MVTTKTPKSIQYLVFYYVLHGTMPILGYYTPAVVNILVVLYLYAYLFYVNKHIVKDILILIPIYLLYIFSYFFGFIDDIQIFGYQLLQLLLYPLLALYLCHTKETKFIKNLFNVVLISYLVTCITTYLGCQMFPGASRDLAAISGEDSNEIYHMYMKYNIGSFSHVYSSILLMILIIYLFKSKIFNKFISFLSLFVIVMTVVATEYTTALIFCCLSLFVLFLPVDFKIRKIIYFSVFMITLYYLGGKILISESFQFLANNIESEIISERLHGLSLLLSDNSMYIEGDIENRSDLYKRAFNTFLSNPFTGSKTGLCGHSYILDSLAKYGIWGLFALVSSYTLLFKTFFYRYKHEEWYSYLCLLFLVALIFAAVNPKDNFSFLTFNVTLFALRFSDMYKSKIVRM